MRIIRMAAAAVALAFLASAVAEDATVVAPDKYKVEFENDKVRVLRITYGPGEESAMHEHPDAVVVNLTDLNVQFTLADGTMPPAEPGPAGSFVWTPAGMHAAKNIGSAPAEALLIEIKD
jgi:quercetin dioxygenase-like cupin family protein